MPKTKDRRKFSHMCREGEDVCMYCGQHIQDWSESCPDVSPEVDAASYLVFALKKASDALLTIADKAGDVPEWNKGGSHYNACRIIKIALAKAAPRF